MSSMCRVSIILNKPLTYSTYSIIFVHGLGGNRQTTWTHQNNTYWPQDLLPDQIPSSRIMTFGYDADMVKIWSIGPTGSNGLHGHGKTLAFTIADSRSTKTSKRRPIIFVTHSLGGLVCEQALLVCRASNEQRLSCVLESTVGIVFMGTPHKGAELALWGSRLAKYVQTIRTVNRDIVRALTKKSEVLAIVEQDFQQLLLKPEHINKTRIFCFYEEVPLPVVGKIVPEESAILEQYSNASIHANHMDMAKFDGETDVGYLAVCGVLKDWIDKLVDKKDQKSGPDSDGDASEALPPPRTSESDSRNQNGSKSHSVGQIQPMNTGDSQSIVAGVGNANLPLTIPGGITSAGGATFVGSNVSGNTFRWDSQ